MPDYEATSEGVRETRRGVLIPRGQLLIDAKAAAAILAIGARTLWRHTCSGAIPSHRIGRAVRYSPEELRRWIDAGCPTTPGAGERLRHAGEAP
jgi:predicted DNA-binding transcriptional regulator AlpA